MIKKSTKESETIATLAMDDEPRRPLISRLNQWPCKINLVPTNAPYFNDADLLITADCAAYAYREFHEDFIKNRVTLIGCPKSFAGDYAQKLTDIITNNDIKSITLVILETSCCNAMESAVRRALEASKKEIPLSTVIITTNGKILYTR